MGLARAAGSRSKQTIGAQGVAPWHSSMVVTKLERSRFMADQITNLTRRRQQLEAEIAQAIENDIGAVLDGRRAGNSDQILRLSQEINILDEALGRLRDVD